MAKPPAVEKKYLFDNPVNVKRLLIGFFACCLLVLALDLIFVAGLADKHAHYSVENWPGFYAMYGFVACVLLVLVSKYVLRPLVMRSEDYYDD